MSTAVVSGGFPHLYRTDVAGAPLDHQPKYIIVKGAGENGSGNLAPLDVNGIYLRVPCLPPGVMGAGTRNCYKKTGGGQIGNADLYIFTNTWGGVWVIDEIGVASYYKVTNADGLPDPPTTGWVADVAGGVSTPAPTLEYVIKWNAGRAVARADVAELHAALTPTVEVEPEHHLINIAAKRALTATEFKQMFYARGDDHFSLANVYECHNISSNILASVWGKRQVHSGTEIVTVGPTALVGTGGFAVGTPGVVTTTATHTFTVGMSVLIKPAAGTFEPNIELAVQVTPGPPQVPGLNGFISTVTSVPSGTTLTLSHNIVVTNVALSSNWTIQRTGEVPYNTSRVINYNRLGGRPDDPSGVDMAYGYATDLQRTFFAQFEVMGNLEKDLCAKRDCWTVCSRMSLEDQLYGLAFVAEDCDDVCMRVSCARKWSEVEDALAESCLAENNTIGYGDIVDLYINVRVTNAHPKAMDTIIRIRFPVQLTRGPDDLGNWNVVASDAADAVLTTGIPYDSVEGGNMQYANASQTEHQAAANNQQQTQLPTSTAPANSNDSTDPHDGVPLS